MRVFIRNSELAKPEPEILASYGDAVTVGNDAHGGGVTNFWVPDEFVRATHTLPPKQYLVEGWRAAQSGLSVNPMMAAEGARRINAVFPADERLASVHELIELLMKYGTDEHNWPGDAITRKAEITRLWHYVRDVTAAAKAQKTVPNDPTSDVHWPTRIT